MLSQVEAHKYWRQLFILIGEFPEAELVCITFCTNGEGFPFGLFQIRTSLLHLISSSQETHQFSWLSRQKYHSFEELGLLAERKVYLMIRNSEITRIVQIWI